MKYAIVTTSDAIISARLEAGLQEHGIDLVRVPLKISYSLTEHYLDGVDITPEEVCRRIEERPVTSQPAPIDFASAYALALGTENTAISKIPSESWQFSQDTQVLAFPLGLRKSGTYDSSVSALSLNNGLADRVRVFDTQTASAGLTFQINAALEAIATGRDMRGIEHAVHAARDNTYIALMIPDLSYPADRLGTDIMAGLLNAAAMLRIKGLFHVREGQIVPFGRARTNQGALNDFLKYLGQQNLGGPVIAYGLHTGLDEFADTLRKKILSTYGRAETTYIPASSNEWIAPAIARYSGKDVFGFALQQKV